jgi:hypothetical protein
MYFVSCRMKFWTLLGFEPLTPHPPRSPSPTPTSLPESDRDSGPRDPDSHSSVLKFSNEEHRDEEYNKLRRLTLKEVRMKSSNFVVGYIFGKPL